jgi:WD40 repeat protein
VAVTLSRQSRSFEILEELGRGGMGIVFKARDLRSKTLVALKVLLSGELASLSDLRRFQVEAEAVRRLDHPNIVAVYECGEEGGVRYLSMQLLEGASLASLSRSCPRRDSAWFRKSVRWMIEISLAVHYAHQRGILHRDIKPGNILLDGRGKAYLTDFGLAKLTEGASSLTGSRFSLGTPQYASPEQLDANTREVTTASDVYSLGAVLYEILTGRPPFVGNSPVAIVRQVLDREARSPRVLNSAVDQDLATICLQCLGKDPGRRYPSAEALAKDLESWLHHKPIRAVPANAMEQTIRLARRHPVASTLALLLILSLMVGGVLVLRSNRDMRRVLEAVAAARESEEVARMSKELAIHHGLINQASAIRNSAALGRRFDAINLLQRAGDVMPSPRLAAEATAALANFDLRELYRLPLPPQIAAESSGHEFLTLGGRLDQVLAYYPSEGLILSPLAGSGLSRQFAGTELGLSPSIVMSPDGAWFVCRRNSMLELWRTNGDKPKARWPPRPADATEATGDMGTVAFSGDSRMLAVPANTGVIRLVHLDEELREHVLASGVDPRLLALDPQGERLAVDRGRQIVFYDTVTGLLSGSFPLRFKPSWIEWSPGRTQIALAACERTRVEVRDVVSGQAVVTIGLDAPAGRLAFHPDGRMLAVATEDKRVSLWDLSRARKLIELEGNSRVLQFSTDGSRLAVAGTRDEIICYEVASSKVYRELVPLPGERSDSGYTLEVSRDGTLGVTADAESVHFWDLESGVETRTMAKLSPVWTRLHLSPDKLELLVNPVDQGVFRYPLQWSESRAANGFRLGNPEPVINRSACGYWGLYDQHALVFDLEQKEAGLWLQGNPEEYLAVADLGDHLTSRPSLSPDGRFLSLNHSPAGVVEIWSVEDAALIQTLSDDFHTGAAFTPDGRYLLTASRNALVLRETQHWTVVRQISDGLRRTESDCLFFSHDGALLLVQNSANSHRIYSYPELVKVIELTSPETLSRHHCEWSVSRQCLYTLGRGNRLYEWNLRALIAELAELGFADSPPRPVALIRD